MRDLLQFRDSVGIRTQDPQLRRLLLYPTELPNRSVCAFCGQILPREGLLTLKAGANIVENFELSKFLMVCEHSCAEERCVPCCKGGLEGIFRTTCSLVRREAVHGGGGWVRGEVGGPGEDEGIAVASGGEESYQETVVGEGETFEPCL